MFLTKVDENTDKVINDGKDMFKLMKMDAHLEEADTKIKIMSAILKRTLPENDDHKLINEFKANRIQVIPEYLMNFKIPC